MTPLIAQVSPLLSLIRKAEARGDYDIVYVGANPKPVKPITQMTVAEVRRWQDDAVRAGSASSAAGAYQIIRKTLDGLIAKKAARWSDKFDKNTQDKLAVALLESAGLHAYLNGDLTVYEFANRVAKVWASFPVTTGPKAGQSFYAGDGLNAALVSVAAALGAVRAIRTAPVPVAPTGFWWRLRGAVGWAWSFLRAIPKHQPKGE